MSTIDDDGEECRRLYEEGRVAMERNETAEAVDKFRRSGELLPHYKTYELLGECLLTLGRVSEAVLFLSAASGLGSRQSRSRYLLARALLQLVPAMEEDALEKLDEALALNPNYKAAMLLREEAKRRVSDR